MRKLALCVGAAAIALGWSSASYALPIAVGYSLNGGATITTLASGNGSADVAGASAGAFSVSVTDSGTPPQAEPTLVTNTIDVASKAAGTISLYVSETGLTDLTFTKFLSGFTENFLIGAIGPVTESTYVHACGATCGPGDLFATTMLLDTTTFSATGGMDKAALVPMGLTTPYAVTAVYTMTAAGSGTVNSSINLTSVPEPAALTVFAAGLLSLTLLRRRRV